MLLQQALIGTASGYGGLQGLPEELRAVVPAQAEAEQQLLLAAGMLAVYHEAGRQTVQRALPLAAAQDTAPRMPPPVQNILDECLRGDWEAWWPSAAQRLARHGYVIAPSRLVGVLNQARPQQQAAWRPLLGNRGLWLARQNPDWSWALAAAASGDVATQWLEGGLSERVAALRGQRGEHAATAREWLQSVWKGEKAEARQALLEAMAVQLGMEDEALLEQCLGDRSQAVARTAAGLLAQLPESALALRLQQRALQWVQWRQAAVPQGTLGKLAARLSGAAAGKLQIELPQTWDKSWSKEGLEETPPQGEGARAFWLRQLLAYVPPALWLQHSGQLPDALIKAAQASEWEEAVLAGWTAATLRFRDAAWAEELFVALAERSGTAEWQEALFPLIAPQRRYALCEASLAQAQRLAVNLLAHCPSPWPDSLNQAMVRATQSAMRQASRSGEDQEQWLEVSAQAALLLPTALLVQYKHWWQETLDALEQHTENWRARHAATALQRQLDLIERRLQFDKEIPL